MTTTAENGASIDRRIGEQVRERRILMGLTQDQVAEALGISYQQIQKYETGSNRVSASRLFQIAQLLKTDVGMFFPNRNTDAAIPEEDSASPRHIIELVRRFSKIENSQIRASILSLVRSLADADTEPAKIYPSLAETDRKSVV